MEKVEMKKNTVDKTYLNNYILDSEIFGKSLVYGVQGINKSKYTDDLVITYKGEDITNYVNFIMFHEMEIFKLLDVVVRMKKEKRHNV